MKIIQKNFLFVFLEEGHEAGDGGTGVNVGNMGIYLAHGAVIRPAAETHGDFLGNPLMVHEGCERMAETVDADERKVIVGAYFIDIAVDGGIVDSNNRIVGSFADGLSAESFDKLRHERDIAAGRLIFSFGLTDELIMLIGDEGTVNMGQRGIKVNVAPAQGKDLGTAEGAECKKGGSFDSGTADGGTEHRYLLGLQKSFLLSDALGKADGRNRDALFGKDGIY